MTDPTDDIPLPSVGVLSEEESAKQIRADMVRGYTDRIKSLERRIEVALGLLSPQINNPNPSVLSIREAVAILRR